MDEDNIVELSVKVDEKKTIKEIKGILKSLKTNLEALEKIDHMEVYLSLDWG